MPRQALVTVVTRNYLPYAEVLQASCRRWEPDTSLYIVVADRLPPESQWQPATEAVVWADQLGIADWSKFTFQYTPFELSCALKPYAMSHVLEQGFEQVAFLDADMALYGPLRSLWKALRSSSIVLSPHLSHPLPDDGRRPTESDFLNVGTYNGGLVACCNDPTGRDFVYWWMEHLRSQCYVDVTHGIYVDQKWLNLVPAIFPNVTSLREPSCNAGHWTLSQYPIVGDRQAGYSIGRYPLECFHFSNFLPADPFQFMHTQTRVSFQNAPALEQLVRDYHTQLQHFGLAKFSTLECQFSRLSNGVLIKPEWREAVRRGHSAVSQLADPFDASAHANLAGLYQSLEPKAKKWRGDWRQQLPSEQLAKKRRRVLKNYWRHLRQRLRRG
jgi:hypothetical protein